MIPEASDSPSIENDSPSSESDSQSLEYYSPFVLSAESKDIAFREYGECDTVKESCLSELRSWLEDHPSIRNCRTDNSFLLRFLRLKKYHLQETKESLERYVKMRMENQSWFKCLDVRNSRIADLIDRGYFFALPERDDLGRRVFFSIPSAVDPSRDTIKDMMNCLEIALESLIEDEENQVRGFVYIFEEQNIGMSVISMWSLKEVVRAFECNQKTMPVRHKESHVINLPFAFYTLFEFVKSLISEKLKKRIKVHSSLEALHKFIPARILPKEYGGVTPLKEIIDIYKQELETKRSKVLSLDEIEWKKCSNKHKKLKPKKFDLPIIKSFGQLEID